MWASFMHWHQHRLRTARLRRRRWLRFWLRPLPRRANLHRYPLVRRCAAAARTRPYLWTFQSGPVRRALYVGLIIAALPAFGIQSLLSLLAAFLVRGNLTVLFGTQLLTNPLTIAPFYWFTHKTGLLFYEAPSLEITSNIVHHFGALLVGGLIVGFALAVFFDLLWRLLSWEVRWWETRHAQASSVLPSHLTG